MVRGFGSRPYADVVRDRVNADRADALTAGTSAITVEDRVIADRLRAAGGPAGFTSSTASAETVTSVIRCHFLFEDPPLTVQTPLWHGGRTV
ncbi:hypothetical protein ABZZ20_30685 [Streptomyces sp. NPDC006430]|uniref:hypothetical protein n=1 Tax=Streptomyces sp. NPDC006430 TaxID=3154299 RepID=UPI0033A59FA6